jgi:GMP synthase (glutamine-hydrolysing)
VDYHPGGREIGTVDIDLLPAAVDDPLFASLPPGFSAHVVHAQTVMEPPPGAVRLAENAFEPTHAFRVGRRAWGVQFHPEFDLVRMTGYVDRLAADLVAGRPRSGSDSGRNPGNPPGGETSADIRGVVLGGSLGMAY